jgi:hypothetical protein
MNLGQTGSGAVSNYLLPRGRQLHVKRSIPTVVQRVSGKRAFKQTLKTSDETVASARSGPLIAQFKHAIEEAQGKRHDCNSAQWHLDHRRHNER